MEIKYAIQCLEAIGFKLTARQKDAVQTLKSAVEQRADNSQSDAIAIDKLKALLKLYCETSPYADYDNQVGASSFVEFIESQQHT